MITRGFLTTSKKGLIIMYNKNSFYNVNNYTAFSLQHVHPHKKIYSFTQQMEIIDEQNRYVF